MLKQKKVPVRMCVGCGEKRPKREMLRIVKTPEGEFHVDATGKQNGRGCYICPDMSCMNAMCKGRKLARSYEMTVDQAVYEGLKEEFEACIVQNGGGAVE